MFPPPPTFFPFLVPQVFFLIGWSLFKLSCFHLGLDALLFRLWVFFTKIVFFPHLIFLFKPFLFFFPLFGDRYVIGLFVTGPPFGFSALLNFYVITPSWMHNCPFPVFFLKIQTGQSFSALSFLWHQTHFPFSWLASILVFPMGTRSPRARLFFWKYSIFPLNSLRVTFTNNFFLFFNRDFFQLSSKVFHHLLFPLCSPSCFSQVPPLPHIWNRKSPFKNMLPSPWTCPPIPSWDFLFVCYVLPKILASSSLSWTGIKNPPTTPSFFTGFLGHFHFGFKNVPFHFCLFPYPAQSPIWFIFWSCYECG